MASPACFSHHSRPPPEGAGLWLSCPSPLALAPSRRLSQGSLVDQHLPCLGCGRSPRISAVSHGCHQGSPGPWAGGWTLVARSRAKRQGQAAWGGSQQQSGSECLLVSWRPSLARPSLLAEPAELWALAIGVPWCASCLVRAAGSGGPGIHCWWLWGDTRPSTVLESWQPLGSF